MDEPHDVHDVYEQMVQQSRSLELDANVQAILEGFVGHRQGAQLLHGVETNTEETTRTEETMQIDDLEDWVQDEFGDD